MEQPIVIENREALQKRIIAAGFGDRFDKIITDALADGKTEIHPFTSEVIENKRMDFEPEIKITDNKGYYNGFKGILHNEDGTTAEQWFKASDRITMNEAYMLMVDQQHPRAVLKTYYNEAGEKYNQWLQLDFSQKTENGNNLTKRFNDYDQVSKLNDFDFVELSSIRQRVSAAAYMSEGREIELTPVNQSNHKLVLMRANPERNTFTLLNADGGLLSHDQFRTQAARERIHREKDTRQSSRVSFVKDSGKPSSDAASQNNIDQVKKKNSRELSASVRPSKRQRVVQEGGARKGKSI